MTLYWIQEAVDERQGQLADQAVGAQPDFWSPPRSTARLRWRRDGDVPPPPSETRRYSTTPLDLFVRNGRTLWHITAIANLPTIVEQGGLLSDAVQQGEGLDPVRVLGWGDNYAGAPSRTYVSFGITYRSMLKEILSVAPGGPALAMVRVDSAAVLRDDGDGIRFFPGWPEAADLGRDGRPGLEGNRGATWLLTPSGAPRPGATVFVPEYVDLSTFREVHLIAPPAGVERAVRDLDWPAACQVEVVDPARWGMS